MQKPWGVLSGYQKLIAAMLISIVLAVAVTACGGGDSSSESSGAATAESTEASGGSSDCATTAESAVTGFTKPVPLKVPAEPLELNKLEGKTYYVVTAATNQFIQEVIDGIVEGGEALGGKVEVYDARAQAPRFAAGISQAIEQGAAGIITIAIPVEIVAPQLEEAKAKGIPVVDLYTDGHNPIPSDPLLAARISTDYEQGGEALTDWMLADSGCEVHDALFYATAFPLYEPLIETMEQQLDQKCGSDCSFASDSFNLATVATKLGPQVSSYIRENPDTNYVQYAADAFGLAAEPAIASADVTVVGFDGTAAVLEAIANESSNFKVTMATAPGSWIGWDAADALGRAVAGQKALDYTIPSRLVDKSNAGDGTTASVWPEYVDFQQEFEAAWKGE